MLGLRRGLLLGLLRQAWRAPPLSGPLCGRRSGFLSLGRWASGLEAPNREAVRSAAAPEEEKFVFPEFLPPEEDEEDQRQPPRLPAPEEEAAAPGRGEAQQRRRPEKRKGHRVTGQPDPSVPASGVSCSGCGAELHCQDAALPGYLPSGKYLKLVAPEEEEEEEGDGEGRKPPGGEAAPNHLEALLEEALCQRCWLLRHHQMALRVRMSPGEYRDVVSAALRRPARPGHPPLVLCLVDLLDLPDSVLPGLAELVGSQAHLFVLGNKVDLLPGDAPGYLKRLRERLLEACAQAGLGVGGDDDDGKSRGEGGGGRVVDVHLVSGRTGFGVEELISKLQSSWKFVGDVYLVGSTNSGKSTLFNLLLHSDFCKSKASDVIKRATVSPWPGTTLNLLKFPIINPRPHRIFQRKSRLQADANKTEDDLSENERKNLNSLKKQGYLVGLVGRTFKKSQDPEELEIEFDAEALSFSTDEEPSFLCKAPAKEVELTYDEVKDARWFYDTPGIVRDGCILNHLNEKELKLALPTYAIVPRTFVLKPGMTLFLGSLGRIDYLQGDQSSWFTVIASNLLPVHITAVEKADAVYQKHAGQDLLKVPIGGEERMKDFPPFESHDVDLEGIGDTEAVADIKFSSAGWVAVTAHLKHKICLKCYAPEGTKLTVRQPPLLPYIVQVKGKRKKKSAAYETVKPPSLVENLKPSRKSRKASSAV